MTKTVMLFCLSSNVVLAGTVHFDPPSAVISPGTPSVNFEVSVSSQMVTSFDTVNVLMFADEGVALHFDYAQSFVDSTTGPPPPPAEFGCFCEFELPPTIAFGGNNFSATPWTSPLLVGTLTVDTSGLHAKTITEFGVNPEFESNLVGSAISLVASGVNQEALSGMATIIVVPEPLALGLIILVSCVVMARKGRVSP